MARCQSCASDVPQGKRFCGDCGASVETPTSAPTATSLSDGPSPSSSPSEHSSVPSFDSQEGVRFLPGTMLAGRYRIVGLLGRGGMGEVYRADDLRLGQTVALKFLPEAFEKDPGRQQRFLGEVRIARQVTHPNVCRVYDVGETEGQHFLSMEYVDGEDLGSLLRRIGRLPEDKAVQLARQICAGLAAAHDQGILHRDLKPANVMIDGRGRARITDFGLAGLADGFKGAEVRAGTPAYMSPEQLSGSGVNMKSDLYSLGLVLYELFTGKQAFSAESAAEMMRLHQESSPTSPTTHVSGLDPAVERVILRCLEKEPTQRPMSALAVAAALPGGDPLAAALAAGETPSPEMVAAAGPEGGMKPVVAVACLAFVLAGLVVVAGLSKMSVLGHLPMGKPLAALVENAREIIVDLGYDEPPVDSVARMSVSLNHFKHLVRGSESIWDHLAEPGQLLFYCIYRQAPEPLLPLNFTGSVGSNDPSPDPGDIDLTLDLRGKLTYFRARPPAVEFAPEPAEEFDWSILFGAAGLDIETFEDTKPTIQPRFYADSRAAWTGILTEAGDTPVRIEAAAYRGKPVYFEKVIPSDEHWSEETYTEAEASEAGTVVGVIILTVFAAVLAGALFLALRNLRVGRGDRRGATRLAAFVFAIRVSAWLIGGHHVADDGEIILVIVTLSGALLLGAFTWVLYMALEPYVRRLWPESLVGWTRLLAGRFRDPLVGRDLLVGMTLGVALQMFSRGFRALGESQGWIPTIPDNNFLSALRGGRFLLGQLLTIHLTSVATPLGLLLFFLFLRLILRRQWIAAGTFVLLTGSLGPLAFTPFVDEISTAMLVVGLLIGALNGFIIMTLLIRFGLLAAGAAMLASGILSQYPVTLDFSVPYVGAGMFGMLVVAGYAFYGFRTSLAGRAVFRDKILEERSA